MKYLSLFLLLSLMACQPESADDKMMDASSLSNVTMQEYSFLDCMYSDSYFPSFLVDKCKQVLLQLCDEIETTKPSSVEALYVLSHQATEHINDLQNEFGAYGSEIETGARECLAENFAAIAAAYGFDADIETLIAPRDW